MTDAPHPISLRVQGEGPEACPFSWTKKAIGGLLVILLIAVGLRLLRANSGSLTFDEVWHYELAQGRGSVHEQVPLNTLIDSLASATDAPNPPSAFHVPANLDHVVHPPLYFLSLRCWLDLFGSHSDLIARSCSIAFGLGAIALLFDAVGFASGSITIAFAASLIFAVAPAQVFLQQQVRGYAAAQCFSCALLAAAVRIEKLDLNRRRVAAVFIATLGLPMSHYFGVFAALSLGFYMLFQFRGRARWVTLSTMTASAIAFAILCGPVMLRQRQEIGPTADTFLKEIGAEGFVNITWHIFARTTSAVTWQFFAPPSVNIQLWAVIVGAILLSPVVVFGRRRPDLRIWVAWLCGTLMFVALLDATRSTRQLAFPRYCAMAMPALCGMVAMVTKALRSPAARVAPATIIIAASLITSLGAYSSENTDNEANWNVYGELLRRIEPAGSTEPIIFYSGVQRPGWFARVFYLEASHYAADLFPRPTVLLDRAADPKLIARLAGQSVLLISGSEPGVESIESILPGGRIEQQTAIKNLATITRVRLPASK